MNSYHDTVWKGVTTTILGIGATSSGLAMKWATSAHAVVAAAPALLSTPLGEFRADDLSTLIGTITTIAGGLWTWILLKRSEKRAADRREADRDADAARARRTEDVMNEVKLFIAREMAKIQVDQAKMTVHLTERLSQQDVMLERVASSVAAAPPPSEGPPR